MNRPRHCREKTMSELGTNKVYLSGLLAATNTCTGKLQTLHFTVCTCGTVSKSPKRSIFNNKKQEEVHKEFRREEEFLGRDPPLSISPFPPPLDCGVRIVS